MEKLRLMPCWKFQSSSTSWKERRRRKCYTGGVRLSPVIFIEKQRTPVVSHVSLSRHHNHAAITGGTTSSNSSCRNERSHPGYTTSLEDTNKAICQRNTNKAICQRKIMDKFIASALLHPQPQLLLLPTVMANSRSYGVGNSSVEAAERRLSAQRSEICDGGGGKRWAAAMMKKMRWWRSEVVAAVEVLMTAEIYGSAAVDGVTRVDNNSKTPVIVSTIIDLCGRAENFTTWLVVQVDGAADMICGCVGLCSLGEPERVYIDAGEPEKGRWSWRVGCLL
nr:hypothetical protein Iba_chr01aCG14890 [Ipomoea batatas]